MVLTGDSGFKKSFHSKAKKCSHLKVRKCSHLKVNKRSRSLFNEETFATLCLFLGLFRFLRQEHHWQETRRVYICSWVKFCNLQFLVKVWSENYIVMWRKRYWMWMRSLFFEKKYSKYIESENVHLYMFTNL